MARFLSALSPACWTDTSPSSTCCSNKVRMCGTTPRSSIFTQLLSERNTAGQQRHLKTRLQYDITYPTSKWSHVKCLIWLAQPVVEQKAWSPHSSYSHCLVGSAALAPRKLYWHQWRYPGYLLWNIKWKMFFSARIEWINTFAFVMIMRLTNIKIFSKGWSLLRTVLASTLSNNSW